MIQKAIEGGETILIVIFIVFIYLDLHLLEFFISFSKKDAFHCAEILKSENYECYEVLTKTKVEFEELKLKNSHRLNYIGTVIKTNEITGELEQIRF